MLFLTSCGLASWALLFCISATRVCARGNDVADCSCGFYDPVTKDLFTESSIVYFNETTQLPADILVPEVYQNQYEKGWNARYRQGYTQSNIILGRDQDGLTDSLQLHINPSDSEHLVIGGAVQTPRRDIFYGSFRTLMRSPRSWIPGSALSMTLHYNDSQTINLDLNDLSESDAWVAMLSQAEFPSRDLGVNYSILSNSTYDLSPWDYTEFRIDWTAKAVKYYVGGNLFRTILRDDATSFPQTPTAFRMKHWSVGDYFTTQGPPANHSVANVGWMRIFFNSSLTTEQDQHAFTQRCSLRDACTTENLALRGYSPYMQESMTKWVQAPNPTRSRTIPIIILIVTGSMSALLVINALIMRMPRGKKRSEKSANEENHGPRIPSYDNSAALVSDAAMVAPSALESANDSKIASYYGSRAVSNYPSTAVSQRGSRAASIHGGTDTPKARMSSSRKSLGPYIHIQMGTTSPSQYAHDEPNRPRLSWREFSDRMEQLQRDESRQSKESLSIYQGENMSTHNEKGSEVSSLSDASRIYRNRSFRDSGSLMDGWPAGEAVEVQVPPRSHARSVMAPALAANPSNTRAAGLYSPAENDHCSCTEEESHQMAPVLRAGKERINYLAGMLSFSCLLVTAIQFTLTFSPASIEPGADIHYNAETWVRKIVSAYFLNLVWVGPFLITSARFLASDYLEHGELGEIARKTIGRPFRLLLPVLAIAMLEYFFMDSGAINWLEYMSSVTWSTWPFTTVPSNFGYFLSEILELGYLIPNAAPQITFNYCTGILWTIPVQLQNSWVAMLGVIVVTQIQTPWKRFGYYTFCLLMHWYALSWGSYFYFGIMLVDLEITYNYRKWLHARPMIYYPLITLSALMVAGGLSLDMVTQLTQVNYADYEYGIHPDIPTGLPIMWTGATGYPQYYVPKLNGIVFAFGLQALVELSPVVQSIFSFKLLLCIYPHIYTIYLIHGFIFWSLGSTVFIFLSTHGFAYWAMVAIVAVCCYATLFVSAILLTPIVNVLGSGDNIWMLAHETPPPRRPTLYPFPSNFLFVRQEYAQDILAEAEPGETPAIVTKDRGRLKKLILGVVAVVAPKLNNQPCQPAEGVASRTNSVTGPGVPARSVGWRTGTLSKSVVQLRRNNSNASRGKPGDSRE